MRIEDHWVEKEMEEILKERKNKIKRGDGSMAKVFFLLILIAFSFCAMSYTTLEASLPQRSDASWTCTGCGRSCWSNFRDWKGNYYCNNCGKAR